MIRLGHSLKLTDRHRQGGWVDPLDGINFVFRFHTNDGVTTSGTEDVMRVSGAGTSEVNGDYWNVGGTWTSPTGYTFASNDLGGTYEWTIQSPASAPMYSAIGSGPNDLAYSSVLGNDPAPTVSLVPAPVYAAQRVFQDAACTIPAINDGHTVQGGRALDGSIAWTIANIMQAHILRFRFGRPVLECPTSDYPAVFTPVGLTRSTACVALRYEPTTGVNSSTSTRRIMPLVSAAGQGMSLGPFTSLLANETAGWSGGANVTDGKSGTDTTLIVGARYSLISRMSASGAAKFRLNGVNGLNIADPSNTTAISVERLTSLGGYWSSLLIGASWTDEEVVAIESYLEGLQPS